MLYLSIMLPVLLLLLLLITTTDLIRTKRHPEHPQAVTVCRSFSKPEENNKFIWNFTVFYGPREGGKAIESLSKKSICSGATE